MAAAADTPNIQTSPTEVFHAKYIEFCTDLENACPELSPAILKAKMLDMPTRIKRYKSEVKVAFQQKPDECPGCVLPGVTITEAIWKELTTGNRHAIHEYCLLLSICMFYLSMSDTDTPQTSAGFMDILKDKFANVDFTKLTDVFSKFFAGIAGVPTGASADTPAAAAAGAEFFAHLSERFMKGKIAKLAEELVSEFHPEDLGMTAEQLAECEHNPSKAFSILADAFTHRPEIFQGAVKKIANRMKLKIQRGELRPEELAAEAQELIQECTGNPAFSEMLETLKSVFGFEDMDMARAQGREGSARLSIVRNRLRAKLEKKKKTNSSQ